MILKMRMCQVMTAPQESRTVRNPFNGGDGSRRRRPVRIGGRVAAALGEGAIAGSRPVGRADLLSTDSAIITVVQIQPSVDLGGLG